MPRPLLKPENPIVVRGWSLWVPPPLTRDGKPKWINANERSHWGGRSGKTKLWREAARLAAEESGIPHLERAWVQAFFTFGGTRKRDVGNLFPTVKACVDGFTDADLWQDDRDGIITGPDLRRAAGDAKGRPFGVEFRIFEVIDGH